MYIHPLGVESVSSSTPQTWATDVTASLGPATVPVTAAEKSAIVAKAKASEGGGFWDTLKKALVGGATAYGTGLAQRGQQQQVVYQQPASTGVGQYLPYIAIGGGILLIALMMRRK